MLSPRLAWVPLTVIVTVAIYLHLRGLPTHNAVRPPTPAPAEKTVPLDEIDESNGEEAATKETIGHPGKIISYMAEI